MARLSPQNSPRASRKPPWRRGVALLRALALLSLLLFCGQTVLPVVHKVLVPHQVCAVHGEWIHADETAAVPEALHRSPGYSPGQPEPEHEHEHCEACIATHHQPGLPSAPASAELTPSEHAPQVAIFSSDRDVSGTERYRLAPKQGPPSSA